MSAENRRRYEEKPADFPDVGVPLQKVAFFGFDATERFPEGVQSSVDGIRTMGLIQNSVMFKEGQFHFARPETREAFALFSERYVTPVGGYCLGAMSRGGVTPGDPNHAMFIPEAGDKGMWAVFGSANGPKAWEAMTSQQRKDALRSAHEHYARLTSLPR